MAEVELDRGDETAVIDSSVAGLFNVCSKMLLLNPDDSGGGGDDEDADDDDDESLSLSSALWSPSFCAFASAVMASGGVCLPELVSGSAATSVSPMRRYLEKYSFWMPSSSE